MIIAQDTVTGAFEGTVSNNITGALIAGAVVEITNEDTGRRYRVRTNSKGLFFLGKLAPGPYEIKVSAPQLESQTLRRELDISVLGEVIPVPVALEPIGAATARQTRDAGDIRTEINTTDARRDESSKNEIVSLPLGASTFSKSFDELALLAPGIAPPPQTIGGIAGPGVGPGVGSAGQFAANGLRSRGNNFTVDGSDNNDEDIGVRRQGFVALIPQPLESIKEYQVISLLAPAQFGRNMGAQVNAVSKSGTNRIRGNLYGSFNSNRLSERDHFDTIGANRTFPIVSATGQPVLLNNLPILASYHSGNEDSFTQSQFGATLGDPLIRDRTFYFLSFERQRSTGEQEETFAVPTVEQRGIFGSGGRGLSQDPFNSNPIFSIPATLEGSALFSLFPYPNNPDGIYGDNSYTTELPSDADAVILSAKIDDNFDFLGRNQSFTARYNFSNDSRFIPTVNQSLFSTIFVTCPDP